MSGLAAAEYFGGYPAAAKASARRFGAPSRAGVCPEHYKDTPNNELRAPDVQLVEITGFQIAASRQIHATSRLPCVPPARFARTPESAQTRGPYAAGPVGKGVTFRIPAARPSGR